MIKTTKMLLMLFQPIEMEDISSLFVHMCSENVSRKEQYDCNPECIMIKLGFVKKSLAFSKVRKYLAVDPRDSDGLTDDIPCPFEMRGHRMINALEREGHKFNYFDKEKKKS